MSMSRLVRAPGGRRGRVVVCFGVPGSGAGRRQAQPGRHGLMLIATALSALTPVLAFFYGGLVARRTANTMMMSFISLGFVGVLGGGRLLVAFTTGSNWIGDLERVPARRRARAEGHIPHLLFMAYQGTFAIITAALISCATSSACGFGVCRLYLAV